MRGPSGKQEHKASNRKGSGRILGSEGPGFSTGLYARALASWRSPARLRPPLRACILTSTAKCDALKKATGVASHFWDWASWFRGCFSFNTENYYNLLT